jgi:hypothetical protein
MRGMVRGKQKTMRHQGCLGVLALMGAMAGCMSTKSPAIRADDPIKMLAQYEQAVAAAQEQLPASLKERHGADRLIRYAQALLKLRSAPSQRFAKAIIQAVQKESVKGADALESPERVAQDWSITYAELAQVEALNQFILDSGDEPSGGKLPFDAGMRVLRTIVAESPSDDVVLRMFRSMPSFVDLTDMRSGSMRSQVSAWRKLTEVMRAGLRRYTDPGRRLNLSSLAFFREMQSTTLGMSMLAYARGLQEPREGDISGLLTSLQHAARRARRVDDSRETQAILTQFIEGIDENRNKIEAMDKGFAVAGKAAPMIRRFFDAVGKGDDSAAKAMLDEPLRGKFASLREKIAPRRGIRAIAVKTIQGTGLTNEMAVVVEVTGDDGKTEERTMGLRVRQVGEEWTINSLAGDGWVITEE